MELHKIYTSRGTSLIEVIIVIGLIGLIGSLIGPIHLNEYQQYSFADERSMFVSNVQKARSRAMHSICLGSKCTNGLPHGIHIEENFYVIFQGDTYVADDPQNEKVHFHTETKVTGPVDIIFNPLSGVASTTPLNSWDVVFTHGSRIATTSLNTEGQITWTQ
jgi:Tfp pilus assembly protein FimT